VLGLQLAHQPCGYACLRMFGCSSCCDWWHKFVMYVTCMLGCAGPMALMLWLDWVT
jgi:hypothetical protein